MIELISTIVGVALLIGGLIYAAKNAPVMPDDFEDKWPEGGAI